MASDHEKSNHGDDAVERGTALLQDLQHWTWVAGRAQQMLLEHGARMMLEGRGDDMTLTMMRVMQNQAEGMIAEWEQEPDAVADGPTMIEKQTEMWGKALDIWQGMITGSIEALSRTAEIEPAARDRRFTDEAWENHPAFRLMRQIYLAMSEQMLALSDKVDGLDIEEKRKLRFACQSIVDASSPSNFLLTNPVVIEHAIETRGESLLKGLEQMLTDMERGQLTQTEEEAFRIGENIADTPGKVVYRTDLFELIQYQPTTEEVLETPLVIFPAWINRFYILDLGEKKSFVRWALDQGISVFMVSWKSADAGMKDVDWGDYIAAQSEAVDEVSRICGTEKAHAIGYCVAGTTLAATLAKLSAEKQANKFASATFFTAQVDFTLAGDLLSFCADDHLALVDELAEPGYLDGRYMAATFNLLRGRDLIWNYVTENYLMGKPHKPFDLLYWNGDTTNVPAAFHKEYLRDLYRDNKLVEPGAISIDGVPLDLGKIETPLYIQSGREDHIAPPESVIKLTHHVSGPYRFIVAGSGHVAGVVNPPSSGKYQHWTREDSDYVTVEEFLEKAEEHPGSWWPDWAAWLKALDPKHVPATGARIPGNGSGKRAVEVLGDAPGDYVKMR